MQPLGLPLGRMAFQGDHIAEPAAIVELIVSWYDNREPGDQGLQA